MRVDAGIGGKILLIARTCTPRNSMSAPNDHHDTATDDPVEKIVPLMPIVLPLAGAAMIFLLAFIAVFLA